MNTVALLVYPNGEIFAANDLRKPWRPPTSGFTNEESEFKKKYEDECFFYKERVRLALKCDQKIASNVLDEQHSDWIKKPNEMQHYDVKNIMMDELRGKVRKTFVKGQSVKCINTSPLFGNEVAPPLKLRKDYPVLQIVLDSAGNQHLDIGLVSKYNFIRSYETGQELPNGDKIHWCHPTRFE